MDALRVVIAPDSFKGSLPAGAVAAAIAGGWRSVRPGDELIELPQADGGEGTLAAIAAAVPGSQLRDAGRVTGPDGRPVPARWLSLPDGTAVVELAEVSGLPLMAALDALGASTRGLGELLERVAVVPAVSAVLIAIGGSASTDGGAGALSALGLRLLDADGDPLPDGGGALAALASADRTGLRELPPVTLLSDVTAPLLGPSGAAAVFGPQKGADPEQVTQLEAGLARLASVLGGDPDQPGAGAAGGVGYGFATAYAATLEPGADRIATVTGLPEALDRADVVISGEGRFDDQSGTGKVVGRILDRVAEYGRAGGGPVPAVIAGQLAADPGCWSAALADLAGSAERALAEPERWLREAGARAARGLP